MTGCWNKVHEWTGPKRCHARRAAEHPQHNEALNLSRPLRGRAGERQGVNLPGLGAVGIQV
jgi:hypothetical protein